MHILGIDSLVSKCFKYCQVHLEHNHDLRGEVSRADDIKLPTSVVDERLGEIRRWSVAGMKQREIFKLLEMDQKGLLLFKVGKK